MAPLKLTICLKKVMTIPWWGIELIIGNHYLTLSLSSNNAILSIGRSSLRFEFSFPARSPIFNVTLLTKPFWSLLTSVTLPIDQRFRGTSDCFNRAISSTLKFLLLLVHFWRSWSDCKYSFLQQDQHSLAICCIHPQRLLL